MGIYERDYSKLTKEEVAFLDKIKSDKNSLQYIESYLIVPIQKLFDTTKVYFQITT